MDYRKERSLAAAIARLADATSQNQESSEGALNPLLALGQNALSINERTVKFHAGNLFVKLPASDRVTLRKWLDNGAPPLPHVPQRPSLGDH
jgi:hypothetical protein